MSYEPVAPDVSVSELVPGARYFFDVGEHPIDDDRLDVHRGVAFRAEFVARSAIGDGDPVILVLRDGLPTSIPEDAVRAIHPVMGWAESWRRIELVLPPVRMAWQLLEDAVRRTDALGEVEGEELRIETLEDALEALGRAMDHLETANQH